MNINDQIFYKAELLTKGMRASDNAKAILYKEFPDFFTKGIMHSLNVRFSETNCNVSIADDFAHESPYLLDEKDGNFFITDGKNSFPVSFFGALPHTGTVVDDFARLHSKGCVTIWPNSNCCYDRENEKCRFCSIVKERETPLDPDVLADSIKKLFELSKDNMLNFSGGTYKNPDVMADYWIDLVKKIRAFSDAKIAIEFAPPSDLEKIAALKNAGADVAIMNLEVANDELRKKICPGKSKISYEHYYKAFEKAVSICDFSASVVTKSLFAMLIESLFLTTLSSGLPEIAFWRIYCSRSISSLYTSQIVLYPLVTIAQVKSYTIADTSLGVNPTSFRSGISNSAFFSKSPSKVLPF